MNELELKIEELASHSLFRWVLSLPVDMKNGYKKIVCRRLENGWQIEKFTEKQAFHENVKENEISSCVYTLFENKFQQITAYSAETEFSIRKTKKGKILTNKKKATQSVEKIDAHNRVKDYFLEEGTVIPPLVDMGVFTNDGRIVKSMYDKYRQINRFVELVDDVLRRYSKNEIQIVDFGCGKSYLTFIVYYYLTKIREIKVNMIGLDLKKEVVEKCNQAAQKYGYTGLHFEVGDIGRYTQTNPVDMVLTLHACDVATDYALAKAVEWNSEIILSVPCCQHELNQQMQSDEFSLFTRYGIVKERISALLTDAIRANMLEANGYKTQLVEFIDMAHTPKNILIRSIRGGVSHEKRQQARNEVERVMKEFALEPTIVALLENIEYNNGKKYKK